MTGRSAPLKGSQPKVSHARESGYLRAVREGGPGRKGGDLMKRDKPGATVSN